MPLRWNAPIPSNSDDKSQHGSNLQLAHASMFVTLVAFIACVLCITSVVDLEIDHAS